MLVVVVRACVIGIPKRVFRHYNVAWTSVCPLLSGSSIGSPVDLEPGVLIMFVVVWFAITAYNSPG